MVQLIPDPPKGEEDVNSSDFVVLAGSESDDDDAELNGGYTMLPAEPNDDENESEEEEMEMTTPASAPDPPGPSSFDEATTEEQVELWSSSHNKEPKMTCADTDAVLKAMEGFKLPASAIPPWAANISEDEWKNHLLAKIRNDE